jgi:hypothetical protein
LETGQVENRVQSLHGAMFTPGLPFGDLAGLNDRLRLRCEELAERRHSEQPQRAFASAHP